MKPVVVQSSGHLVVAHVFQSKNEQRHALAYSVLLALLSLVLLLRLGLYDWAMPNFLFALMAAAASALSWAQGQTKEEIQIDTNSRTIRSTTRLWGYQAGKTKVVSLESVSGLTVGRQLALWAVMAKFGDNWLTLSAYPAKETADAICELFAQTLLPEAVTQGAPPAV